MCACCCPLCVRACVYVLARARARVCVCVCVCVRACAYTRVACPEPPVSHFTEIPAGPYFSARGPILRIGNVERPWTTYSPREATSGYDLWFEVETLDVRGSPIWRLTAKATSESPPVHLSEWKKEDEERERKRVCMCASEWERGGEKHACGAHAFLAPINERTRVTRRGVRNLAWFQWIARIAKPMEFAARFPAVITQAENSSRSWFARISSEQLLGIFFLQIDHEIVDPEFVNSIKCCSICKFFIRKFIIRKRFDGM